MTPKEAKDTEVAVSGDNTLDINSLGLSSLGISVDDLAGMSGIDKVKARDIIVPELKLIKKATKDYELGSIVLPSGKVLKGLDGDVLKDLCILNIEETRVMFPPKYTAGNNQFICRSFDNIKGADDGKYAGRKCADCEFSQFADGEPGQCRFQFVLLCTLPDEPVAFHITVKGVNISPFKREFISREMLYATRLSKRVLGGYTILGAIRFEARVKMLDTANGQIPIFEFLVDEEGEGITLPNGDTIKGVVDKSRIAKNLEAYAQYDDIRSSALGSMTDLNEVDETDVDMDRQEGINDNAF